MKNRLYSILLVLIQFACIGMLLLLEGSIFDSVISITISAVGFLLGLYTLYYNRFGNFNVQPELKVGASLITKGAYKYIRHPMYVSVILIMFGIVLSKITVISMSLFTILLITLYLKASKEERLWKKESTSYETYMLKTKMFIPFFF